MLETRFAEQLLKSVIIGLNCKLNFRIHLYPIVKQNSQTRRAVKASDSIDEPIKYGSTKGGPTGLHTGNGGPRVLQRLIDINRTNAKGPVESSDSVYKTTNHSNTYENRQGSLITKGS